MSKNVVLVVVLKAISKLCFEADFCTNKTKHVQIRPQMPVFEAEKSQQQNIPKGRFRS